MGFHFLLKRVRHLLTVKGTIFRHQAKKRKDKMVGRGSLRWVYLVSGAVQPKQG